MDEFFPGEGIIHRERSSNSEGAWNDMRTLSLSPVCADIPDFDLFD